MRVLSTEEGVPLALTDELRADLRSACGRLQRQLRPRSTILEESAAGCTIRGVIGTIGVRPGVMLEVTPKTPADGDWIAATLDLLLPPTRIDLAGERRAGLARRRDLVDVLAGIYAERLRRALRRDGPILVMERSESVMPVLRGKLRSTAWASHEPWNPNRLPVAFQELTPANHFNRVLARVAMLLARATTVARTRGVLLDAARTLAPRTAEGAATGDPISPGRLPPQWAAYQPAWDIAVAVLARRSLLGSVGARNGVSIALEAWPLLEQLLTRSLGAAVQLGADQRPGLMAPRKAAPLLYRLGGEEEGLDRSTIPDGSLRWGEGCLATFEAKYTPCAHGELPKEGHVFQALTTAAACRSPLAVLVYPAKFDSCWWRVQGFDGRPGHLATIGLGLFQYRRGSGDRARGQRLLDLLEGPPAPNGTGELASGVSTAGAAITSGGSATSGSTATSGHILASASIVAGAGIVASAST